MNNRKKMATLVVSGMLALTLLVGGITFALFTDTASNEGNTFSAGTLSIESHRHDVPIEGPMFYTNNGDNAGWMGTGEWAPRDSHTRALFLTNTGTLEGKLTNIEAISEGNSANDLAFAEQSLVTIVSFEAPAGTNFAASVMKSVNEAYDASYKSGMSWWLTRPATRTFAQLNAAVRRDFLDNVFDATGIWISNVEVYTGYLDDLVGGHSPFEEITVGPNKTLYMGYAVTLLSDVDDNRGFSNNDIQGDQVQFSFKSTFTQTANN